MDFMTVLNEYLLPHWPFVAMVFLAGTLGQFFKNAVWTKERAKSGSPRWLWSWARKTLALHPVLLGAVLGAIWREPEAGVDGLVPSMVYFALAGALSTWAYEFIRGFARDHGVELKEPGAEDEELSEDSK